MPVQTTTPGIYIEEDATPAISVNRTATAVPLFIGKFIRKNEHNSDESDTLQFTRISSWLDFTQKFSLPGTARVTLTSTPPPQDKEDSGYTYTISATTPPALTSWHSLQLYFQNGGGACYICALADDASADTLTTLIAETPAITMLVCAEAEATYRNKVYSAVASFIDDVNAGGIFLLADSQDGETVPGISASPHVAAWYPSLQIHASQPDDDLVTINGYADDKDEAVPENMTLGMLKTRNPPLAQEIASTLKNQTGQTRWDVPASIAIAGIWCYSDRTRGVWKAPANIALNGISGVKERITDDQQGTMNAKGINVVRDFRDRGYVVWGARTLKTDDDNWRYIPVRRLFDSVERDIKKALRPMVFEPNSQPTWQHVRTAIDNYLHSLWQQGALTGNTPAEAWFVQIGKGITMTEDDIKQGKLIVAIGIAAVRPAEFIVLQFTQDMSS